MPSAKAMHAEAAMSARMPRMSRSLLSSSPE
jgi:hypothetical protein